MSHSISSTFSETDRIDPVSDVIELSSGTQIRMLPLKMRQLFRLMRIITRGGSQYLPLLREALSSSSGEDVVEVFGTQLIAVAIMALPEAEDDAVEFIQSVVEPANLLTRNDKQSKEHNSSVRDALFDELFNPDPDDVVTIIEAIVLRESKDLVALGKRLGAMLTVATKVTQNDSTKTHSESTEPTPILSAPLPAPSISSLPSMDGQTMSSSISQSVV